MLKSVKTITFTAECFLEGSWGSRDLGERQCSMQLYQSDVWHNDHLCLQIEFIAGDDVEHIGITVNRDNKCVDYEGVFSIPEQGIKLLQSVGYDTSEIE